MQDLGDGVGALAPKYFLPSPFPRKTTFGGRRGTHCLLELNVGSVLGYCVGPIVVV